jgi:hypothetical protein
MGFPFKQEIALLHLGNCYYELNDLEDYINVYTKYTATHPHAGWAFANLGKIGVRRHFLTEC